MEIQTLAIIHLAIFSSFVGWFNPLQDRGSFSLFWKLSLIIGSLMSLVGSSLYPSHSEILKYVPSFGYIFIHCNKLKLNCFNHCHSVLKILKNVVKVLILIMFIGNKFAFLHTILASLTSCRHRLAESWWFLDLWLIPSTPYHSQSKFVPSIPLIQFHPSPRLGPSPLCSI